MTRIIHKDHGPVQMVPVEATEDMHRNTIGTDNRLRILEFVKPGTGSEPYLMHRTIWPAMVQAAPADPQADVVALYEALFEARSFAIECIDANGGIDGCELLDRLALERIDAALSRFTLEEDDA